MITKQTKFIGGIAVALFIAMCVAVVVAVYSIIAQGERLENQMVLLADVTAQQQRIGEVDRILEASATDRAELETLFLTEADTIDFLATIEEAARMRGIELTTESLKVEEPKDEPAVLVINFTFSGQPAEVREFITLLESVPYGSYLTDLQVQVQRESGTAEAKLALTILLLPTYD